MGVVYVEAEVAREGGVALPVRLLVDSGAVYSVLPTEVWTALGLVPSREMEFILADGTLVARRVSHCMFTYAGKRAWPFTPDGALTTAPLLGRRSSDQPRKKCTERSARSMTGAQ
jgi:predicted aspartyl protease